MYERGGVKGLVAKNSLNVKEEFRFWLENETTIKTQGTINTYLEALDDLEKWWDEHQGESINIWKVPNTFIEKYSQKELFEKDSELSHYDKKIRGGNGQISAAYGWYKEFLDVFKERTKLIGMNKIYYGLDETVKSEKVKKFIQRNGLPNYNERKDYENVFRIFAHTEYLYSDFVGYRVSTLNKSQEEDTISYTFQAGPFTKALDYAIKYSNQIVYLIIENLSSADVSRIFGDTYQLLIRENDGISRYPIKNEMISREIYGDANRNIRLPRNLFLLGTLNTDKMNSAEIDLSLKRRFEFEYISTNKETIEESNYKNNWEQIIYYGAPGTGKSYKMQQDYPDFKRVTFHPEYSYTDFIGGLRPVQKDTISYEFVSGALTDSIVKALKNPDKKVGLIIEEINRGNTAAIFGDTFQLLDRDKNGWSNYGIVNKEMLDYFNAQNLKINEIKFPSNLSIVATMNNADQNIYIMDSAFKRRWGRKYVAIDFENSALADENVAGFDMSWDNFGTVLNNHLSTIGVEEDKLIGQYFLTKDELASKENVASKLLIYLWDDVVRYNRNQIFTETKNFNELLNRFKSGGSDIFVEALKEKLEGV